MRVGFQVQESFFEGRSQGLRDALMCAISVIGDARCLQDDLETFEGHLVFLDLVEHPREDSGAVASTVIKHTQRGEMIACEEGGFKEGVRV